MENTNAPRTAFCLAVAGVMCTVALTARAQQAPFFMIVHPDNPVEILSPTQIAYLFDGAEATWVHGTEVVPVDLPADSAVRGAFERYLTTNVTGLRTDALGRSSATLIATSDAEAVDLVTKNPGAIGYVSTGADLGTVRLVPIVQPPKILRRVPPEYTRQGLRFKVEGEVVLDLEIGTDGTVEHVSVVEELQFGLTEEAVKAVKRWTFEPATSGGVPVSAPYRVTITFQLGR